MIRKKTHRSASKKIGAACDLCPGDDSRQQSVRQMLEHARADQSSGEKQPVIQIILVEEEEAYLKQALPEKTRR